MNVVINDAFVSSEKKPTFTDSSPFSSFELKSSSFLGMRAWQVT